MLPYLKRKEAGVSAPVDTQRRTPDPVDNTAELNSAAIDILSAIKRNDSQMLAQALRAVFQLCDLEPHEEGLHK